MVAVYYPSFSEFRQYAKQGNTIPVYRQLLSDALTPVSAFGRIAEGEHAFLLESVVGIEKVARYSFLGTDPFLFFRARGDQLTITDANRETHLTHPDPLAKLEELLSGYRAVRVKDVPRFSGGAVGYLAYDAVRYLEDLPQAPADRLGLPDLFFMLFDSMVIFDHIYKTVKVVCNAHTEGKSPEEVYHQACGKVDRLVEALGQPGDLVGRDIQADVTADLGYESNFSRSKFEASVRRAKEYIRAGDVIQVVLSQRLSLETSAPPFEIYRTLRVINPSPYNFFLKMGDLKLVGSSPEVMVRVEEGRVTVRPIAGTRRRGRTEEEDLELERELASEPKEQAEHIMLLDLARNDVGRIARFGTVKVDERMIIERFSHVMHITSNVSGELRKGCSAFDALSASLPAGTVSGAPKVRAMQIIDELEPDRRGPYAGAVGYIDFSGNLDTCIAIRTIVLKGSTAHVQAGAGIVADSVPEREYEETLNKARGLLLAIQLAQNRST
jgi:anthranilate synthase component 1